MEKKAEVCQEFGLVNSTILTLKKKESKLLVLWAESIDNTAISKA
jgi:hypothetical protein